VGEALCYAIGEMQPTRKPRPRGQRPKPARLQFDPFKWSAQWRHIDRRPSVPQLLSICVDLEVRPLGLDSSGGIWIGKITDDPEPRISWVPVRNARSQGENNG
jgi:hypothetical protein